MLTLVALLLTASPVEVWADRTCPSQRRANDDNSTLKGKQADRAQCLRRAMNGALDRVLLPLKAQKAAEFPAWMALQKDFNRFIGDACEAAERDQWLVPEENLRGSGTAAGYHAWRCTQAAYAWRGLFADAVARGDAATLETVLSAWGPPGERAAGLTRARIAAVKRAMAHAPEAVSTEESSARPVSRGEWREHLAQLERAAAAPAELAHRQCALLTLTLKDCEPRLAATYQAAVWLDESVELLREPPPAPAQEDDEAMPPSWEWAEGACPTEDNPPNATTAVRMELEWRRAECLRRAARREFEGVVSRFPGKGTEWKELETDADGFVKEACELAQQAGDVRLEEGARRAGPFESSGVPSCLQRAYAWRGALAEAFAEGNGSVREAVLGESVEDGAQAERIGRAYLAEVERASKRERAVAPKLPEYLRPITREEWSAFIGRVHSAVHRPAELARRYCALLEGVQVKDCERRLAASYWSALWLPEREVHE